MVPERWNLWDKDGRQRNREKRLRGKWGVQIESWWDLYNNPLFNEDIKSIWKLILQHFYFSEWVWKEQS